MAALQFVQGILPSNEADAKTSFRAVHKDSGSAVKGLATSHKSRQEAGSE